MLQVGGRDLRGASHKEAVEAIRQAGDPVEFLVQSVAQEFPVGSGMGRPGRVLAALA